jgi:hypothetical protein
MFNTINETITITELSKYGVRIGNTYYNYGKKWDTTVTLAPGLTYVVEIWSSASGKKYMNKLVQGPLDNAAPVAVPVAAPALVSVVSAAVPASSHVGKPSGSRDFDAEARGKTRCALYAAAIQSPAAPVLAATEQELINFAKRVANEGVRFTFGE